MTGLVSEPPSAAQFVVVGGGPAALSAARAYRAAGGGGAVALLTADSHPPYQRPPLSKDYLRGEADAADLSLEDESFYRDQDISLHLSTQVRGLDPAARELHLQDGASMRYDACVLATGSAPCRLPVPGADHPAVHHLRSRADADALLAAARQARTAVVVGSGFIGCEAAASLAARGIEVTVLSQEPRPHQDRLGTGPAARIATWLTEDGVRFVGRADVSGVESGHTVVLADGTRLTGDLVLVAAGAEPQAELAEEAGLDCERGRVLVDAAMRTSAPGVFAAGDVAYAHNLAAGRRVAVEHWGDALRMGEIAGTGAAGGEDGWAQAPGFWSQIGGRTLKYAAWGDGYDATALVNHEGGGFTAWYARDGRIAGVLTHQADLHYERGRELLERTKPSWST